MPLIHPRFISRNRRRGNVMKERGAGGKKKEAQINKRSTFLSGSLKLADSREPTVFVLKSPNRNNGLAGWIMKKTTAKEGG